MKPPDHEKRNPCIFALLLVVVFTIAGCQTQQAQNI